MKRATRSFAGTPLDDTDTDTDADTNTDTGTVCGWLVWLNAHGARVTFDSHESIDGH